MGGYSTTRMSNNVHDKLYARVFVIEDNEVFVIIQADLFGVDFAFTDTIIEKMNTEFNIKSENIIICCTHTHSGPGGIFKIGKNNFLFENMGAYDYVLTEYIARLIIGGVRKCFSNMTNFVLTASISHLEGIGSNRLDQAKPYDNQLQLLRFNLEDGRQAVIYNYACHPTVLDRTNMSFSADFPGRAAKVVETNGIDMAAFINGACGDVSTRFTRMNSSFDEVERIGRILGGEVLKLANQVTEYEQLRHIEIKKNQVMLKKKTLLSVDDAQALLEKEQKRLNSAVSYGIKEGELRVYQSAVEGAKHNLFLSKTDDGSKFLNVVYNVLRINDIFIICIPGELFSSLGMKLKESFHGKKIMISCYTNGYIGYIPDEASYNSGGLEVNSSLLAAGEGERLVGDIIKTIDSM